MHGFGVLNPEDGGAEPVLGGVGARIDDIGPHQRQRAGEPREQPRMIGGGKARPRRVAVGRLAESRTLRSTSESGLGGRARQAALYTAVQREGEATSK